MPFPIGDQLEPTLSLTVCQIFAYFVKKLLARIALNGIPMRELRDDSHSMGSHSVTCHPTQVNAPRLNHSQ